LHARRCARDRAREARLWSSPAAVGCGSCHCVAGARESRVGSPYARRCSHGYVGSSSRSYGSPRQEVFPHPFSRASEFPFSALPVPRGESGTFAACPSSQPHPMQACPAFAGVLPARGRACALTLRRLPTHVRYGGGLLLSWLPAGPLSARSPKRRSCRVGRCPGCTAASCFAHRSALLRCVFPSAVRQILSDCSIALLLYHTPPSSTILSVL